MIKLAAVLTLVCAASHAWADEPAKTEPAQPEPAKPAEPQAGDFNAGGQARFPSGPDEDGKYASFNWVAVDLKARYYLRKQITLDANVPLAIIHPDTAGAMGPSPSTFGGFTLTLDARMRAPKMPGMKYAGTIGLTLTGAYMKEGAMLLSDKDYPLFTGDLKPGFATGLVTIVKMSSLVDFSFIPTFVYQSGTGEARQGLQVPLALRLGVGSLAKINVEAGFYTGDDFSMGPSHGGRIATGLSLDLKISHLVLHAGAGFASLLVADSGLYPTIKDSFYIELNAKYAK